MFAGISMWQLLIVLAIVIMIFGTKKLRNMGGDLGSAVKGFKDAMNKEPEDSKKPEALTDQKMQDADFEETKKKDQDKV